MSRDALQRDSSEDAILKICLRNHSSLMPFRGGIWSISYVKYMGYQVWLSISFFLGSLLLLQNRLWDFEFWYTCIVTAMHSFAGMKRKLLQNVAHNIGHYHVNFFFLPRGAINCSFFCIYGTDYPSFYWDKANIPCR